ncbi:MAG: hypothetical protein ACXQS5_07385 [Candidatus Methanospirareceae archaeon]
MFNSIRKRISYQIIALRLCFAQIDVIIGIVILTLVMKMAAPRLTIREEKSPLRLRHAVDTIVANKYRE